MDRTDELVSGYGFLYLLLLHIVHITVILFTVAANEVNPSSKLHIGMIESECCWASKPNFLLTLESFMNNLEREF
jgi:hypothetical protein